MNKPTNWDTTKAMTGDFQTLPPGGYICTILSAKLEKSKTNKEMIIIAYDIADGEYKDFFKKMFDNNTSQFRKWPGVYNQLTEGKSLGFFKGMIESLEKSNPGYTWNWDETALKGKRFGGIFGREEYFNGSKGEYRWSTKLQFIKTVEAITSGNFKTPEDKPAQRGSTATLAMASGGEQYTNLPAYSNEDDIPF